MLKKIWNKFKNCWKSRSVWVGSLMTVLSALQANMVGLEPIMEGKTYILWMFGLSMAQVILRFDTNKGLDEK